MKYSFLSVAGADRHSFLQGQLTQDVDRLGAGIVLPAAWCTPKGRVIVTCHAFEAGETIYLAIPAASLELVIKRLTMYRLRADVTLAIDENYVATALAGIDADRLRRHGILPSLLPGTTDIVEAFGERSAFADAGIDLRSSLDEPSWSAARIAAGRVDIDIDNDDRYTPHMLNLDLCDAISFDKGCYTGQEIVARTQHLGTVKRRINRYLTSGAEAQIGDQLTLADKTAGEVVNAAGNEILAVVAVADHEKVLSIDTGEALPQPLPYHRNRT